ncbi:MAG TPA: GNAT family N-acetyltransferase [Steroidobacteraceae bacterium]|nr:GNAT family N-acetyltransferase [Steroidobacteraceae bacterium]
MSDQILHPAVSGNRWVTQIQRYPVIATTHLRLRPFVLSDISALVNPVTRQRIASTTLAVPYPFDTRQARRWIESHARAWQDGSAAHWAISALDDDRLVGYVGLHDIDNRKERAELSLWVAERSERKEFGIEAAEAALAFAFTDLQLGRVQACQLAGNPLLARILRRIGMKAEITVLRTLCRWGRSDDGWVWSIDHADWMNSLQAAAAEATD